MAQLRTLTQRVSRGCSQGGDQGCRHLKVQVGRGLLPNSLEGCRPDLVSYGLLDGGPGSSHKGLSIGQVTLWQQG